MAKKQKETEKEIEKEGNQRSFFSRLRTFFSDERTRVVFGILIIIFCMYVLLAFISFFFTGAYDQSRLESQNPGNALELRNEIKNWTGYRGAYIADFFINRTFGIACFVYLFFFFIVGLRMIKIKTFPLVRTFFISTFLLLWTSLFFGFFFIPTYESTFLYLGGAHGYQLSLWLESQIGWFGTILFILTTLLVFSIIAIPATYPCLKKIGILLKEKIFNKKNPEQEGETEVTAENEIPAEVQSDFIGQETTLTDNIEEEDADVSDPNGQEWIIHPAEANTEKDKPILLADDFEVTVAKSEGENEPVMIDETELPDQEPEITFDIEVNPDEEFYGDELGVYDPTLDLSHYQYPTFDLLKKYDNIETSFNPTEQNANKDKIVQTLENYGIKIDSVKATIGPTITLYEIVPAPGVRISKIKNLENDIALSLAALGIRIIAPIPGKGTIGIEVPNRDAQIVPMQSVLASKKFQECKYDLPVAFGKTITNDIYMIDLAKMPHLLVAGATGQGKSVGLNAIITSLLYKKHPSQLKFVLVDPKKVEFNIYSNIEKHFLAKIPDAEEAIITDVTKVVQTLNSLTKEMDMRYDLLKKARMRNIKEYNDKFINRKLNPEKGHRYLPYIVVIIDEFGDLIMTAGKEVELPIARIAQLARAVGIHMIIATQRPSTNIITGTIKANFPARLAFRVASMIDSRTILDSPGANQLIGRGDMLFLQGSDLTRVQCAFVDTPEVEKIADFIGDQQGYPTAFLLPEYEADANGEMKGGVDLSNRDPMFEEAAQLVVVHQQGSTSLIQRKFAIGYNRAGRIMDQLEAAGIVGPTEGSKARQVLVQDITQLEMILSGMK
jgi:S-DNA-T family DNA segregation ATPase FtsK/SpoIIIE